jgi:hypothetical protein
MKEKVQAIFLQIQHWSSVLPKNGAQIDQNTLPHSRITHRTTKTKLLRIRPATLLSLAQPNNQPTIPRR